MKPAPKSDGHLGEHHLGEHHLAGRDLADRDLAMWESAHDLNNLLTAIIGAADSALQGVAIDPETRADIMHIREGAWRGVELVLGHGSSDDGTQGVVSVNASIRGTSRLLAHRLGPRIALVLELEEADDRVRIEPSRLDRILLNLLANADHAMPDGGTATLRTERRRLTESKTCLPDTIPAGDYVVVSVADTGPGIAEERLPRIFERGFSFWQGVNGSGLGLASVRDNVRRSHGFLAVETVEGHGSRFEIWLPWRDGETQRTRSIEPRHPAFAGVVLLVEDEWLVGQVAERILHREGWTVMHADSAEVALEMLQESACDLMISDMALPGMDGLALTGRVRERWPKLPVVLTSGYAAPTGADGAQVPDVTFLTKPYGRAELLSVVSRVVEPGRRTGR
jgi:two-component system, cell cycle sensor histidine kinase and response regulator CckA